METKNSGILASISWNSNLWASKATKEDISFSKYSYVMQNGRMHEDLNFAHEILPCEEDGTFIAYTPMFNRLPSKTASKYVDIIYFRSMNYKTKQNAIVGFYAFPTIKNVDRLAKHKLYKQYSWGNVAALPENIILFNSFIEISNEIIIKEKYLPEGKMLGQQGFNYLHMGNVVNILTKALELNPKNKKLKKIKSLIGQNI